LKIRFLLPAVAAGVVWLSACSQALGLGMAYTVTSTGDGDNTGPNTMCVDAMGNCTLRAAIQASNSHAGDDGILFDIPTTDPGYNAAAGTWTINLPRQLPDLSSNIAITGPGAAQLIVKGGSSGQGFRVFNVTATGTVTLSGITISQAVLQTAGLHGAGVQNVNAGTLNIVDCVLNNLLSVSNGGGIYNDTGIVNISGTTFHETNTHNNGGGVYNQSGTVNITNCYFVSNNALGSNGTVAMGAAIANSTGKVNVTNSLVNACFGDKGSVVNFFSGGVISLANCTLTANVAQAGGGAITATDGTVNLSNCTIVGNSISNAPNGGAGGISVSVPGVVNVKSTLIAKNTATGFNVWPEVSGTFASKGFNLVGDASGSNGSFNAPTDHTGPSGGGTPLDAKIDPNGLQNNGGPTQTIALLFGSPAIDNGITGIDPITGGPLTTDQRGNGFSRTFNDPNITNASDGTDIGAFEVQTAAPPPPTPTATPTPTAAPKLVELSTRMAVQTGDNVLFGGFIVSGNQPKKVIIRAIGPSLTNFGVQGALTDPTLQLFSGSTPLDSNDNWMDSPDKQAIIDSSVAPSDSRESAILKTLPAGASYTAILRGANNTAGIGVVEVYDLDTAADSTLANISSRGFVQTGDNVMFAGVYVGGTSPLKVIIRALGPSLSGFGVQGALANPALELHDANATTIEANDNWVDSSNKQAILDSGIPPSNDLESAIVRTLSPGPPYTAIVRGVSNTTGVAVVEIYALP
jgi:CSLREA domain-containing protein